MTHAAAHPGHGIFFLDKRSIIPYKWVKEKDMKIEEALKYIENSINYWVEVAEYENKEKDVKKTNQAWTVIVKVLGKND